MDLYRKQNTQKGRSLDRDFTSALDNNRLRKELEEKSRLLELCNQQLKSMINDFNFNLQLISERDKEIEFLIRENKELADLIKEKDLRLESIEKMHERIVKLENDNAILSQRVKVLISSKNYPSIQERKSLDQPALCLEKHSKSNKILLSTDKVVEKYKSSQIFPLNKLNSSLEKRIKDLKNENRLNESKSLEKLRTEASEVSESQTTRVYHKSFQSSISSTESSNKPSISNSAGDLSRNDKLTLATNRISKLNEFLLKQPQFSKPQRK